MYKRIKRALNSPSAPTILWTTQPHLTEGCPNRVAVLAQAYQCFGLVASHDASNSGSHILALPSILAPYPSRY